VRSRAPARPTSDYDGGVSARQGSSLGAGLLLAVAACSFPTQGQGDDALDDVLDDVLDDDLPPPRDADPAAPDAAPGAPDARPAPDATPGFDPATDCPEDYAPAIFAGGSRYRYMAPDALENFRIFAGSVAECASDAPGLTHLAVPDVDGEVELWMDIIDADYGSRWTWLGVYRDAGQATWRDVLGNDFSPAGPAARGQLRADQRRPRRGALHAAGRRRGVRRAPLSRVARRLRVRR
jgi:hypothetical protein